MSFCRTGVLDYFYHVIFVCQTAQQVAVLLFEKLTNLLIHLIHHTLLIP